MEKLNIAELLKDCPKGMELDCTVYDSVQLDAITEGHIYPIDIQTPEGIISLSEYGCYSLNSQAKCVIFPKGKTTWKGFQRPFKDGDVVTYKYENGLVSMMLNKFVNFVEVHYHCALYDNAKGFITNNYIVGEPEYTYLATEEEKQKLFQAIKDNGYKWNPETKTLEKLIEPKFKVGDRVKHKDGYFSGEVTKINGEYFILKYDSDAEGSVDIRYQDDYELVSNKFDITTLKPFDKVLVRNTNGQVWTADLFSHILNTNPYLSITFVCLGHCPNQCIPFEGNEHLLGTTNGCDEYYKTWK